jgi:hypothetical protein
MSQEKALRRHPHSAHRAKNDEAASTLVERMSGSRRFAGRRKTFRTVRKPSKSPGCRSSDLLRLPRGFRPEGGPQQKHDHAYQRQDSGLQAAEGKGPLAWA